jgi:V/A-type H+-transporting ATPase subunit B
VVGEEGLSDSDRRYLALGSAFESRLVNQAGARTLAQSMDVGWQLLRALPRNELARLSDAQIDTHLGREEFVGV